MLLCHLMVNLMGHSWGKKVILPSSFTGSPRYQHQLYQDAMGIVCRFGKPDFFVTFTCNPRWQEIMDALLPGQTAENHQDIVASFQVEVEIPSA